VKVNLVLNDRKKTFNISPDEYLLETLRNNHITSVKNGCNGSTCGVCTVLLDEKPVLSCSVLTARLEGRSVKTVDDLHSEIEKISNEFGKEGADQCGFCNPGLALTIYALKKELTNPTDEEIKSYVVGNLCRCTGYQSQFIAIKKYLGEKK